MHIELTPASPVSPNYVDARLREVQTRISRASGATQMAEDEECLQQIEVTLGLLQLLHIRLTAKLAIDGARYGKV